MLSAPSLTCDAFANLISSCMPLRTGAVWVKIAARGIFHIAAVRRSCWHRFHQSDVLPQGSGGCCWVLLHQRYTKREFSQHSLPAKLLNVFLPLQSSLWGLAGFPYWCGTWCGEFQFSAVATPRVSSTSFLVVSPVVTLLLCSGFILLSDVYVHRCADAQKLVNTGVL